MTNEPAYPPIGDYALIGDCRAAALVSKSGSIDWLCLPRFDSPAFFSSVLDTVRGGRFSIRPTAPYTVTRRYLGHSNVLETTFTTTAGVLRLTDAMTVRSERERRGDIAPEHEVLRRIEVEAGEVEVQVVCDPRPDFGQLSGDRSRFRDRRALGFTCQHGDQVLALRADVPLALTEGGKNGVVGRFTLPAGERRFVSLSSTSHEPAVFPPLGDLAEGRMSLSQRFWEGWIAGCRYEGPFAETVLRSLLTLKLLTYAPSGAVIAAPTTSLPEEIGGVRNWDYRYCWLRDASWTLTSFLDLGFREEGTAFFSWLLYATRMARTRLNALYDVHGETRLREKELGELSGYAGSRPVRVGNGAIGQLQLDIYGEVLDAAFQYSERGGEIDRLEGRFLVGLGESVCGLWKEPDEGIWEKRSGRRHHTYSKAMCWVALDRLVQLHDKGVVRAPRESFATARDEIRERIEREGYDAERASYVDVLAEPESGVDASLLLLGLRGYADPATSPRLQSTFRRLEAELGRDGLVFRYPPGEDGVAGGEAAFGICSFWSAEFLARLGDVDGARLRFESVAAYANDVGLFAEEIDPATGRALGNFPQAFTHVGLLSAALALTEAMGRSRTPLPAPAANEKGVRM